MIFRASTDFIACEKDKCLDLGNAATTAHFYSNPKYVSAVGSMVRPDTAILLLEALCGSNHRGQRILEPRNTICFGLYPFPLTQKAC